MAQSYFSSSWHRVAHLKPRLKSHVKAHRQVHRGQTWYVVEDAQTGKHNRLPLPVFRLISHMNGQHTVDDIWEKSQNILGEEPPSQDEMINLLARLHQADLLIVGETPDLGELAERSKKIRRSNMLSRVKNPMAMRLRLFDPNAFLDHTHRYVDWVFSALGASIWFLVFAIAAVILALNFDEARNNVVDQVLTANNLFLMFMIYPVIKAIHEFGHAYAVKKWGGEVHEIGVLLLAFLPMPYVDASASIAFQSKWRRMTVAAAGILVELFIAAIGVVVWSLAEDGLVKAMAMNAAVIGGVSTLLFNGNPLMRFDGYFVFSDLVESPNLGKRSNDYVLYLIKRHILGVPQAHPPEMSQGEPLFFVVFSVASAVYRTFAMLGIALYIAGKYFFIGVSLALLTVWLSVLYPLFKGVKYLVAHPALDQGRHRALVKVSLVMVAVYALLFLAPVPFGTLSTGVLAVGNEHAFVRNQAPGRIEEHPIMQAGPVIAGTLLFRLLDEQTNSDVAIARARLSELTTMRDAALTTDRAEAAALQGQVEREQQRLLKLQGDQTELSIRARNDGYFVPARMEDLESRHLPRGTLLGYLLQPDDVVVKAIVPHTAIESVWNNTRFVQVRLSSQPGERLNAEVVREQPDAIETLPSAALAASNGGPFALDPTSGGQNAPLETLFEITLQVDGVGAEDWIGQRAHIYFGHRWQPIGPRVLRAMRQLFLRQFQI